MSDVWRLDGTPLREGQQVLLTSNDTIGMILEVNPHPHEPDVPVAHVYFKNPRKHVHLVMRPGKYRYSWNAKIWTSLS